MALNEDEGERASDLDRVLSEEVDGYEPPNEAELEEWRESTPHPAEAVEYDSSERGDGSYE